MIDRMYSEYFPRFSLLLGIFSGTLVAIISIPTIEYTADIAIIVERSFLISQGVNPLRWPDPPLRYLPISLVMYILTPLDLSPEIIVTGYTIGTEFILIPIMMYRAIRAWWSKYAGGWAVLIYGFFAPIILPDIIPNATLVLVNTMYSGVFWMYAFAIPPMLFAWEQFSCENYILAGISLGIVALIELPMAAFAALTIAVAGLITREYSGVAKAAVASIITSSPLIIFAIYHIDYWLEAGTSNKLSNSDLFVNGTQSIGGISVTPLEAKLTGTAIFVIFGLTFLLLYYKSDTFYRAVDRTPPIIKSQIIVLTSLEFVLGIVLLSIWYHILIIYIFRFSIFSIFGIIVACLIKQYISTPIKSAQ